MTDTDTNAESPKGEQHDCTPNEDLRSLVQRVRSQSRIFSEGTQERRCLEWAADEIEGEINE